MNSKQLWNRRAQLVEAMNAAATEERMDDALRIEGQIAALDERIADALEQEEQARNAAAAGTINREHATLGERLFGARDAFTGIEPGFSVAVPLRDAASSLPTPQIYHRELPALVAPPAGFLATLAHGTTDGDEHFFQIPTLTNNAAGWSSGNKAESAIAWTDDVAHIETIAHWIPINKQTARRYGQLESLTSGALMLGLDLKCNYLSLRGSNSSGIKGIMNYSGVLSHTMASGKNIKDTIWTMKRKVRVACGIEPNYVALSPFAIEEMAQAKDEIGNYLFPELEKGGTVCGLEIVEDVNMTNSSTHKEEALVYYSGGATWNVADPQEVTVGLTGNQLIQNAYTLLAELTADLRVDMPQAFCKCTDLGLTVES